MVGALRQFLKRSRACVDAGEGKRLKKRLKQRSAL
jgi:hypothetical protein